MPHDARHLLSIQALEQCLDCKFETENLDFKQSLDLSTRRGVLELAKDVLAMTNSVGGYIVAGIEDKTFRLVGLPSSEAALFHDGARINDKLRSVCNEQVSVQAALHQVPDAGGQLINIALICVYPQDEMLPAPVDGSYDQSREGKKTETKWVFRQGDVLIRKGDSSTRAISKQDYQRRPFNFDDLLTFRAPCVASEETEEFRNPYNFAVVARDEMFKGREREVNQLLSAVENGWHVSVFGLQRIGKTSLVEETFTERIKQRPRLAGKVAFAKINLQMLGSEYITYKHLFQTIVQALAEALPSAADGQTARNAIEEFLAAPRRYKDGDKSAIFDDYRRVVEQIARLSPCKIVLFLDEFSELCRAIERHDELIRKRIARRETIHPHDMFVDVPLMHFFSSLLKSEQLRGKLTLILAVRPFVAEYDSEHGLQILKLTKPVYLYYLEEQAATRLIMDPLHGVFTIDKATIGTLYQLTAGHPYLIQFIMQELVEQVRGDGRTCITQSDVAAIRDEMISQGAVYSAQFDILDSDYSVDEVTDADKAELGRGVLAVISKFGTARKEGWVPERDVEQELAHYGIGERTAADILKKFEAAKIIEEKMVDEALCLRVCVPLLRKRYVAQNMLPRYFRNAPKKPI